MRRLGEFTRQGRLYFRACILFRFGLYRKIACANSQRLAKPSLPGDTTLCVRIYSHSRAREFGRWLPQVCAQAEAQVGLPIWSSTIRKVSFCLSHCNPLVTKLSVFMPQSQRVRRIRYVPARFLNSLLSG